MPKSAFGVDLAMNCATTIAFFLKLTVMGRAKRNPINPISKQGINRLNLQNKLIP
ncbi:MAG: hypothetical protein OXU23_24250 [Candidatus Poribacteria bacterium]|nr:hypothetical protein [Candidatus Poribacteria bacterium]MDE0316900.1 hypothetical protein [Candidatus Poribacteria bacterium]